MLAESTAQMAWYLPLLIFVARIGDVSISTVRTIILLSGHKFLAAALGFIEVIIWVLAVGFALRYIDHPTALIGYAGGYAAGILVGMTIEQRIAMGYRMVTVISRDRDSKVAKSLRDNGYTVTELDGRGHSGPVEVAMLAVRRRKVRQIRDIVQSTDDQAFITVEYCDRPHAGPSTALFGQRRPLSARLPWFAGGFMRR